MPPILLLLSLLPPLLLLQLLRLPLLPLLSLSLRVHGTPSDLLAPFAQTQRPLPQVLSLSKGVSLFLFPCLSIRGSLPSSS